MLLQFTSKYSFSFVTLSWAIHMFYSSPCCGRCLQFLKISTRGRHASRLPFSSRVQFFFFFLSGTTIRLLHQSHTADKLAAFLTKNLSKRRRRHTVAEKHASGCCYTQGSAARNIYSLAYCKYRDRLHLEGILKTSRADECRGVIYIHKACFCKTCEGVTLLLVTTGRCFIPGL